MHPVRKGSIVMDGVGGQVCGELICAPCSSSFSNEDGISCCPVHSNISPADDEDKENEDERTVEAFTVKKKKRGKVTSKAAKTSEYSAKDLLVLSQALLWRVPRRRETNFGMRWQLHSIC
jgi:uncharacterized Zn finger protein (UPF0148 family)